MITFKKFSGFGQSTARIRYLSPYTPEFGSGGKMRFFPKDIKNILDIEVVDGNFCVYTYPHNDGTNIAQVLSKEEEALKSLLLKAEPDEEGIYTIIIEEDSIRILNERDFSDFSPRTANGDEMFVFGSSTNKKFPNIFVVPAFQRMCKGEDVLKILARISHTAMEPVFESLLGNEFTWALVSSSFTGKYKPMPYGMTGLQFPSNGEIALPSMLNQKELIAISRKFDTLKVASSTFNETFAEEAVESGEVVGESYIFKQAQEKKEITLSDLVEYGVLETLKLLAPVDFRVDVRVDISGIVQKMCIFGGKIHYIPGEVLEEMDPEDFFGAASYNFVCHANKDSFPKTA